MKMESNMLSAINAYIGGVKIKTLQGLCEFIDNSLSAKAKNIKIKFHPGLLEVIDDGVGTDFPEDILTPFKSRGMDSTSMYGVGAAGCIIVLSDWGTCTVQSSTGDGVLNTCVMDWGKYRGVKSGDAEITRRHSSLGEGKGTIIAIGFARQITPDQHQKYIDAISFRYASALQCGISISYEVKGQVTDILPWKGPELSRSESVVFTTENIGEIEVMCGIVKAGHKNDRPGFNVYWGKRILIESESGPCEIHDTSTSRIYGTIKLDADKFRHVNTLKDGFNNNFDPNVHLWPAIANHFKDILLSSRSEGMTVQLQMLSEKAAEILNNMTGVEMGREKRDKKELPAKGPENPKQTGRQRKTAEKISGSGEATSREKKKGFPMTFKMTPSTTQEVAFKCVPLSISWDIQFNPDMLPKEMRTPYSLATSSLFCIAQAWEKRGETDSRGNRLMPGFTEGDFETILTKLIESLAKQKPPEI